MYFNICIDIFLKTFSFVRLRHSWTYTLQYSPIHLYLLPSSPASSTRLWRKINLQMLIYCNQFLFVNISFNSYSNLVFMPIGRDFLNSCTDFSLHRNVLHENVHVAKRKETVYQLSLSRKEVFSTLVWYLSATNYS